MNKTPTTLIIMDGFGLVQTIPSATRLRAANTPVLDGLFAEYAHTTLQASGLDVGLPDGPDGQQRGRPYQHRRAAASCSRTCRASPAPLRTVRSLKIPPTTRRWTTALKRALRCTFTVCTPPAACTATLDHLFALLEDGASTKGVKRVYIHALSRRARHRPRPPAAALSHRPWKSATRSASARSRPSWAATTRWTATSAGTASRTPTTRSSTARACRTATPSTPSRRAMKTA